MVQEKQLRELFKYIEQKWDVAVEDSHKTDIKRIFGGVLCEDIIKDTLHEVKAEPYKVQISKHTLVEVNRAFRALKQDRNSYIHKVFNDDGVFDAMDEIRKMFDNYFVEQPQEQQPELNQIEQAYERGEKIRKKTWEKDAWIKKHTEIMSMHDDACLRKKVWYNFDTYPNLWELYTEPAEPSSQAILDNSFDRERFERLFCAVVANGGHELDCKEAINLTQVALSELDAYYAEKIGGNEK